MKLKYVALALLISGCSSTKYNNNGVGAYIPYDSSPNYSNLKISDRPYLPKEKPAIDHKKSDDTQSVNLAQPSAPLKTNFGAESNKLNSVNSIKSLPSTEISPSNDKVEVINETSLIDQADNVIVSTINGDVVSGSINNAEESSFKKERESYTFRMKPGLLKPQITSLLLHHPNIKEESGVIWKAKDNLVWPNNYVVSAKEFDIVLNEILKPYNLYAEFKKNQIVIISESPGV